MKVLFYPSSKIYKRPEVLKRLKFLTNGGWGRHAVGSGLLDSIRHEKTGWMLLAWEQGQIIGWAFINRRRFDSKLQIGVYVARSWRRKGVGSKLLEKARQFAKEEGRELVCQPWNNAGYSFYEKHSVSYTWEF